MTREEAGAKLADEYASKHWSGDDYTAAFDSFIAGYQAALTPQPSAEDAAVLDALEEAYADVLDIPDKIAGVDSIAAVNARHTEARAAVLARMAKKVPEGWRDISTAPTEGHVLLGGYVVPSAAAQANGSKIVWHYGIGTALWDGQWSGFLGSRPTHWMPLPSAPKVPTTGMICAAVGEITSHQARVVWPAMLAAAPKVPEGWQPLSTLEHRHAYNEPLVMDGKNMPATYFSDNVILTDGKRVWVEQSVIMGGALSSSADKFTAYPSGDKPTHWMPLPAAPKVPT